MQTITLYKLEMDKKVANGSCECETSGDCEAANYCKKSARAIDPNKIYYPGGTQADHDFDMGSGPVIYFESESHDPVNHPTHYTSHPSGVECIQITRHMNFNLGNAIKYIWRASLKNGIEDLEKAEFYIKDEIARLRGGSK